MNRITYIIGAGASFHSIPIVNKMNERIVPAIQGIINANIQNDIFSKDIFLNSIDVQKLKQKLVDDATWIVEKAGDNSIDTLAKRFSDLRDNENLSKLKSVLSTYIIYEQKNKPDFPQSLGEANRTIDPRYIEFFAKASRREGEKVVLNKNISIISWNYDIQFEFVYSLYYENESIYEFHDLLNAIPSYGSKTRNIDDVENTFSLIRLNGFAGMVEDRSNSSIEPLIRKFSETENETKEITALRVFAYHNLSSQNIHSCLRFAFEEENDKLHTLEYAIKVAQITSQLIIIGYSFPDFNREYDAKIFKNVRSTTKIIIQDNEAGFMRNKEIIESFFDTRTKPQIIHYNELTRFYLPPIKY